MSQKQLHIVNQSVPKVDGEKLVTGAAKYTDDFDLPGMLHAKLLMSPHPHARIKNIKTDKAKALPGVHAVLTYKDIPMIRHSSAGQSYPEPSPYDKVILDNKVRFIGDRVAVVAAESLEIAEKAVQLIEVEYEVLPAVTDLEDAMKPGAPVIHDEPEATGIHDAAKNIASYQKAEMGDVDKALEEADIVVERTYRTQRQQHCALETHGSLAYLDGNDRLVVITSTQVPFHTRRQLGYILNMPLSRIRVIKPRIGGGFGGKQGKFMEDLVAVLALKTRRPVKLIYKRDEEFVGGYTRHGQLITLKTGVKKDGTIIAQDMRIISDTGAYGDHALTVGSSSGRKVLPLYPPTNMRFELFGVYTNLPISGAMRGYGAIQGFFALESQMDEVAKALNMDPLEFRQKNMIQPEEVDLVANAFGEKEDRVMLSCGLAECIERGAAAIGWKEKHGKPGDGKIKRGIGMACSMQGSGIAGVDWAGATIKLNDDGTFTLFIGATDLGTGADTVLTQIAAEALGVGMEDFATIAADTDLTPFDVGAYASSTTYVTGGAVQRAAEQVRAEILRIAGKMLDAKPETLTYHPKAKQNPVCTMSAPNGKAVSLREVALYAVYEEKQQITKTDSFMSHTSPPPFTAQFAEIEVDTETGQVQVVNYVAAVDCGVAINPQLAEGQVEGAVAQGLGFALFEEMVFENGKLMNPNFADYKLFNAYDMPPLETILVETYEPTGPYGAKSVSEVPINCPAPAIANAIYDAIGVRITNPPMTAQKVLEALKQQ